MATSEGKFKILITGGHHTTAFAVLDALSRQLSVVSCQLSTVWVGHKFSMAGDRSESLEYKEVTSRRLRFFDLRAPRFHRRNRLLFVAGFCGSVFKSLRILISEHPNLVLSFGGYLSSPVIFSAWLLRIPCLTHEQTSEAGFANRFNANFCQKVLISFESSRKYFPHGKTVLTGNPVRPEIFEDRGYFKFDSDRPTIYVTGGKQGSHVINEALAKLLPDLLETVNVIHQAGSSTVFDDYSNLTKLAASWTRNLKDNYLLRDHFEAGEVGSVFAGAGLVISRAGANTVCELAALRKRAILIPISGSSHREQERNARLLKDLGLAQILEEGNLTGENLLLNIKKMLSLGPAVVDEEAIDKIFLPDAAQKVADEVFKALRIAS